MLYLRVSARNSHHLELPLSSYCLWEPFEALQVDRNKEMNKKKSDMSMTFLILWKLLGFQADVGRRKFPTDVREDQSHRERSHCVSPLSTSVSMFQYWYLWVSVCFLCITRVSFTELWTDNSSVEISVSQLLDSLLDPSVLLISTYRDSSYPPLQPM